MKARLPESLLGRGKNEHPLHRTSEASASGNHLEPAGLERLMRATLDVCCFCKQKPRRSPKSDATSEILSTYERYR